ncbi:GMP reductase 2-like, partial [Clarias magur]
SVAVSTGTGETDFERLTEILVSVPQIHYVCVDVANGYSEHFVHFVKDVREKFPSHTIM